MVIVRKWYVSPDDPITQDILYLLLSFQGESEHRRVKRFYPTTWKANYTRGITKQQRRQQILRNMGSRYRKLAIAESEDSEATHTSQKHQLPKQSHKRTTHRGPMLQFEDEETLPATDPERHYHISSDTKFKLNIQRWVIEHENDMAFRVCL